MEDITQEAKAEEISQEPLDKKPDPNSETTAITPTTATTTTKRSKKRLPQVLRALQSSIESGNIQYLIEEEYDPLDGPELKYAKGGSAVFPSANVATQEEVEFYIIKKMREHKQKMIVRSLGFSVDQAKLYDLGMVGPYTELDLQELLNPEDRIENLVLHSAKRHRLNTQQLQGVMQNAMEMIENDHKFLMRLQRLATILQGDDPKFNKSVTMFIDSGKSHVDEDVLRARDVVNSFTLNYQVYLEKLHEIRGRISFVLLRKKQFLKSLKDRYLQAGYEV